MNQTDDQIGIRVSENYELSDRTCYLFFCSPNSDEIFTKALTIRQSGCKFKLSKRVIVFSLSKLSERVDCNPYGTSCEIKHRPKWCTVQEVSGGYNLFVGMSLYEERQEELIITAHIGDEEIDKSVLLIQKPLCPDENHPHMIDLGLPSGTKWSCCNAGASSPEKVGNYYSWGNHSPLKKENGNYNDCDYPFFEWKDLNNDGMVAWNYQESFIKLDEAYSSAVSGSWGNGSMSSDNDFNEIKTVIDNLKEKELKWRSFTLNGSDGAIFTGENGNSIFIPYTNEGLWVYSHSDKRAWVCNQSKYGPNVNLGYGPIHDETTNEGKNKYIHGRPVRPVSK